MSIKNETQYKITMERIDWFRRALKRVDKTPETIYKPIQKAAMQSIVDELEEDVEEYERNKPGERITLEEAARIALEIGERAQRERIEAAEEEAKRGIQYDD